MSAEARRLLVRSLLIQALWNPRDLQGSALAWALDEPVRPDHPPEPFNAHPYLAGVALGALAREAREARLPDEARLRFRAALRAPLGALGDSLVWAGWVPLLVLLAAGMLLVGASPGVTAVTLLLAHNILHLGLRRWGVHLGLRHGVGVGAALAASPLRALGDRARQGAVAGAGVILGLVLVRGGSALVSGEATLAAPSALTRTGAPATTPGGAIEVVPEPWSWVLPGSGVALLALVAGGLLLATLGGILAGRLPATTPLRLLLLLAGAGWVAGLLLAGAP